MKESKKNNDYRHITSLKELRSERSHLAYKAKYSEKQLEIRLLEIGYYLNPVRLVPSLVTEWAQPMLIELKNSVIAYFFGRKKKRH